MRRIGILVLWLAAVGTASPARALTADELLLVVNKNVPEGRELAEHYAKARGVPDGRIVELDLPAAGDEIAFDTYETAVVPPLFDAILERALAGKVKCLVTFYGVPLRIGARVNSPRDEAELASTKQELAQHLEQVSVHVAALEELARRAQKEFSPPNGKTLPALGMRADVAVRILGQHLAGLQDLAAREALSNLVGRTLDPLMSKSAQAEQRLRELAAAKGPRLTAAQQAEADRIAKYLTKLRQDVTRAQCRRADPESRAAIRRLMKDHCSPFDYARLLEGLIEYFNTDKTESAVDSELACLSWGFYSRVNWLPNPMNVHVVEHAFPPMLMTMRLDGPTPQHVRAIIDTCIAVERNGGLSGRVVIDSGGHLQIGGKSPAYAEYDAKLRRLAEFVRNKTALECTFDEKREVLPAGSEKDVAIYTGWYAVRRYTPACKFVPGAVGFHTASFEMVSLHQAGETGWCRGLLLDGIAATVGPVSEPFLHAFPPPDEFFPLLLTGRLTLAEVYWKTTPCMSWRMVMVGDPLYTPYRARPAVKAEDVPAVVAPALAAPKTRPATSPAK